MNENNQNVSTHHTVKVAVFDRVIPPKELSATRPKCTIEELDDSAFLCSSAEHVKQRLNYIVMVSRILTEYVKCMEPLKSEVIQHIAHDHSKEMRKKSHKVSLTILNWVLLDFEHRIILKFFKISKLNVIHLCSSGLFGNNL